MDLKECINNLVSTNNQTRAFIEATKGKDSDNTLLACVEFIKQSNYNSGISLSFGYYLQLCNDSKLLKQYELKDIELLYDSFMALNNHNLDIYVEAANFAEAVMDDKMKAKKIVDIGINKLKNQLLELEELNKKLND